MTEDDFKVMWGKDYKTGNEVEHEYMMEQIGITTKGLLVWMGLLMVGLGFWAVVIIGVIAVVSR